MRYSTEICLRVFNDDDGSHLYVGPDADGLDCVDIRAVEPDNRIAARITMTLEQARELSGALDKYLSLMANHAN